MLPCNPRTPRHPSHANPCVEHISCALGRHVLQRLVERGAVSALCPEQTGKAHAVYCAANTYSAGEAFPRPAKRDVADDADGGDEAAVDIEPLAEIEQERLRNIERNQEILRQLGLA